MAFDKQAYQKNYWPEYRRINKERIAKRMKAYRAANREKLSAQRKKYREEKQDQLRDYHVEYRNKNQVKIKNQQRSWREKNRAHYNQKQSAYFKTPLGKLRNCANRARSRQIGALSITGIFRDVLFANIRKYGGEIVCEKCKRKAPLAFHFDHIIPLSRGGKTERDNLQILCAHCNESKGSLSADYRFTLLLMEMNP
jgi:5-methylcytosine-specific restriction endonuclease McrA